MIRSRLNRNKAAALTSATFCLAFTLPGSVHAQRSVAFEVRLGVTASSTLAADSVVRQSVLDRLAGKGHRVDAARATPSIAPTIQLSASTALRSKVQLEGAFGLSVGQLNGGATSGNGQSFTVASGTIGLRYAIIPRAYVRGAFGAIHYGSSAEGIFKQGSTLEPVVEADIGSSTQLSFGAVSIEAFGQVHRFGTAALRQIGGSDGTVLRAGLMAGLALGKGR